MNELEPIRIEEANCSTGDSIAASIDYEGLASLEIENPWSGDTESGFGRTAAIRLTKPQAVFLAAWLMEWAQP